MSVQLAHRRAEQALRLRSGFVAAETEQIMQSQRCLPAVVPNCPSLRRVGKSALRYAALGIT